MLLTHEISELLTREISIQFLHFPCDIYDKMRKIVLHNSDTHFFFTLKSNASKKKQYYKNLCYSAESFIMDVDDNAGD